MTKQFVIEARERLFEKHNRIKELLLEEGPLSWSELQEASGYTPNDLYKVMCQSPLTRNTFRKCGSGAKSDTWWLQ